MIKDENTPLARSLPMGDVVIESSAKSFESKPGKGSPLKPSLFKVRLQNQQRTLTLSSSESDGSSSVPTILPCPSPSSSSGGGSFADAPMVIPWSTGKSKEAAVDTPSKLGTVQMFIRDSNRGGIASPAGKIQITRGSKGNVIQVLTPTCKGPWGEGGDLVALKEWNEQFRKADPIINTPKASYPQTKTQDTLSITSRDSTPPTQLNFCLSSPVSPKIEGPTCRFLGKHLSDVAQLRKATESSDEETHRRLLRVTPTVTEKGLARAIDDCDTKKLVGTKDQPSESEEEKEARQKERLERIASKEDGGRRTKEDLIAEYVSRMHQEYEQLRSLAAAEEEEEAEEADFGGWGVSEFVSEFVGELDDLEFLEGDEQDEDEDEMI